MDTSKKNIPEKLSQITELFQPTEIASFNDQKIMLVKSEGGFPWHLHEESDEFFYCLEGHVQIQYRDHTVDLLPGDCAVVPKGVEHRTNAVVPSAVILMEAEGTLNTGNVVDHEYSRHDQKKI